MWYLLLILGLWVFFAPTLDAQAQEVRPQSANSQGVRHQSTASQDKRVQEAATQKAAYLRFRASAPDIAPLVFQLAFEGDLKKLKKTLRHHPQFKLQQRNLEGQTVLHIAAQQGHLAVLKYVLKNNKNKMFYKDVDQWGRTPLYYAVTGGHLPIVQYWLSKSFLKKFIQPQTSKPKTLDPLSRVDDVGAAQLKTRGTTSDGTTSGVTPSVYSQDPHLRWTDHMLRGPLHWAALYGQTQITQWLLKQKWQVDRKDLNGRTPAYLAVLKGQLEVLKVLAAAGAQLNSTDIGGQSLLWQAFQNARWQVADWLVQQGVHIKTRVHNKGLLQLGIEKHSVKSVQILQSAGLDLKALKHSVTELPLHWALQATAPPRLLEYLVAQGLNINQANALGIRPLHVAVREHRLDLLQKVIDLGADVNAHTISNKSPLILAVQHKQTQAVKLLLQKGAQVSHVYQNAQWTLLHEAAMLGVYDITKLLLQHTKLNIESRESLTQRTALGVALTHGHFMVAHLLLQHGADLNVRMPRGQSLLHLAVEDHNFEAVKFLHDQDLSLELYNDEHLTPLHRAMQHLTHPRQKDKRAQIVNFLLKQKACVQVFDQQGQGLLNEAYMLRDEFLMKRLIHAGAQEGVFFQPQHKSSLLHWAVERGGLDVLKILMQNHLQPPQCGQGAQAASLSRMLQSQRQGVSPFLLAMRLGYLQSMRFLFQQARKLWPQASPEQVLQRLSAAKGGAKNSLTRTLEVAVMSGQVSMLQFLVEDLGLSPHIRDTRGRTSLHMVVMRGKLDMLHYLLSLKVDINARDRWWGRTPLHIAAIKGYTQIAELLLQAGADKNVPDMGGLLPFQIAQRWGHKDLARLLETARSAAR